MDILLVTSEIAPYSQATAIAQSVASLAKALRGLHHKVTVISPLYASVDPNSRSLARRLSKVEVRLGERRFQCELYDGRTTGGVDLVFIGEPKLFGERAEVMTGADASATLESAVFARAAAEVARARDPQPEVLHAFGACAGLVLVHAKTLLPTARRLLSVHDKDLSGALGNLSAAELGLDAPTVGDLGLASTSNLLSIGAAAAERVLLSSATVADQWLADPTTLDGKLASPPNKVLVIAEGVDAAIWNPLTDAALSSRFDPTDQTGKRHCKAQLQRELQLPERADVPLVVVLGSLGAPDKLASVVSDLLNNDLQLAVISRTEGDELTALAKIQERFPDRVALHRGANDAAIHQALGAADLLLLPALSEPRDQLHRCAQRYGALPIVARVGGVQDVIVDCDPALTTGTGFLFDDEASLLPTIQRSLAAYARTQAFEKLRVRVMRLDSSWERSARLYEQAVQSRKLTN